jgi:exodeoxyribonuclease V alpha subunit
MANGHCGLAEDELLVQAEKLLEIPSDTLAGALQAELGSGEVVADLIDTRRSIFLAYLWRAERLIADRLKTLI